MRKLYSLDICRGSLSSIGLFGQQQHCALGWIWQLYGTDTEGFDVKHKVERYIGMSVVAWNDSGINRLKIARTLNTVFAQHERDKVCMV